ASFFFNDTATAEHYTTTDTLSLHDALPISPYISARQPRMASSNGGAGKPRRSEEHTSELQSPVVISYAVFCLKKKKHQGGRARSPDTCRRTMRFLQQLEC